MIQTTQEMSFWKKKKKKKGVDYFWQSVVAILDEVSVAKTIVWC